MRERVTGWLIFVFLAEGVLLLTLLLIVSAVRILER